LLERHTRSVRPAASPRLSSPSNPVPIVAGEAAALQILLDYGIPVPRFEIVGDEVALSGAAGRIGYPLVLKTAESVDHKTEMGGVVVGVADEPSLGEAYRHLATRLGPLVMVAEQIPDGVEIGLGMFDDERFGPVVMISAGGWLIETLADRVAVLPPIDGAGAMRALDRLRIRPVLDGVRGRPGTDVDALVEVIARFSELAADGAGQIKAMDVNPVIVGPAGAVAVDALIVSR
jgi:succinyl-CoA synthetase beta subunit